MELRSQEDLRECQEQAIQFGLDTPKCGLFLDMGLGKTASSLSIIKENLDQFFVLRYLIIAPLRVANTVWKQEASKWEHLKDLRIEICTGSPQARSEALTRDADVYVINKENLVWLMDNHKWKWDGVVIDESTGFKSYKSKRFKALRRANKYIKSMILLSGTPSPQGMMDLWSQIFLLDSGVRLGRNITAFRKRFFDQVGWNGYGYELKEGADDKIKKSIKDICITMSAEDHIETLPEQIDIFEYVDIPAKVKRQYDQFRKQFVLELDHIDIMAPSAGGVHNKLLQICNGCVYDEDGNYHELHDAKLQSLKEIIEDNPNENFLVAYNYKTDLIRLKKTFPDAVVLSKEGDEIEDWNKGNIKMLICHPASAGHGLNIQEGGAVVVWFGLNWSLELYKQFNARLVRQGQLKDTVRVIHIIAKGLLDEDLMAALTTKEKNLTNLITYLKYRINNQ